MVIRWDSLCGRDSVRTETDTVNMFGGAMCCWDCYSIYQARKSWHDVMEVVYP
jgi:hypothetical protein